MKRTNKMMISMINRFLVIFVLAFFGLSAENQNISKYNPTALHWGNFSVFDKENFGDKNAFTITAIAPNYIDLKAQYVRSEMRRALSEPDPWYKSIIPGYESTKDEMKDLVDLVYNKFNPFEYASSAWGICVSNGANQPAGPDNLFMVADNVSGNIWFANFSDLLPMNLTSGAEDLLDFFGVNIPDIKIPNGNKILFPQKADYSRDAFNDPRGIGTDRAGNFWIADKGNDRIVRFFFNTTSKKMEYKGAINGFKSPHDVAFIKSQNGKRDLICIANTSNSSIVLVEPYFEGESSLYALARKDWREIQVITNSNVVLTICSPYSVTSHENSLFVAHRDNKISKLVRTSDFAFLYEGNTAEWPVKGLITCIKSDNNGDLFVVDNTNSYLGKYNNKLELIYSTGGYNNGDLRKTEHLGFDRPRYIAVGKEAENVFVTERFHEWSGLKNFFNWSRFFKEQVSFNIECVGENETPENLEVNFSLTKKGKVSLQLYSVPADGSNLVPLLPILEFDGISGVNPAQTIPLSQFQQPFILSQVYMGYFRLSDESQQSGEYSDELKFWMDFREPKFLDDPVVGRKYFNPIYTSPNVTFDVNRETWVTFKLGAIGENLDVGEGIYIDGKKRFSRLGEGYQTEELSVNPSLITKDKEYQLWVEMQSIPCGTPTSIQVPGNNSTVVLDQTPPEFKILGAWMKQFNPTQFIDPAHLFQVSIKDNAAAEIKFSVIVVNEQNEWVFTHTDNKGYFPSPMDDQGTSDAPNISELWDGKDHLGNILPDGVYYYKFSVQDEAGNEATLTSPGFILDTSAPKISLTLNTTNQLLETNRRNDNVLILNSDGDFSLQYDYSDLTPDKMVCRMHLHDPNTYSYVRSFDVLNPVTLSASGQGNLTISASDFPKDGLYSFGFYGEDLVYNSGHNNLTPNIVTGSPDGQRIDFIQINQRPPELNISVFPNRIKSGRTTSLIVSSFVRGDMVPAESRYSLEVNLENDGQAVPFSVPQDLQTLDVNQPTVTIPYTHNQAHGTSKFTFTVTVNDNIGGTGNSQTQKIDFFVDKFPPQISDNGNTDMPEKFYVMGQVNDPDLTNEENVNGFDYYSIYYSPGEITKFPTEIDANWQTNNIFVPLDKVDRNSKTGAAFPYTNVGDNFDAVTNSLGDGTIAYFNASSLTGSYTLLLVAHEKNEDSENFTISDENSVLKTYTLGTPDKYVPEIEQLHVITPKNQSGFSPTSFTYKAVDGELEFRGTVAEVESGAQESLHDISLFIYQVGAKHYDENYVVNQKQTAISNGGGFSFVWDGKDKTGNYVKNGEYKAMIIIKEMVSYGRGYDSFLLDGKIAVETPLIFTEGTLGGSYIAIGAKSDGTPQNTASFKFKISKLSDVYLGVSDNTQSFDPNSPNYLFTVGPIKTDKSSNAYYSIFWDGVNPETGLNAALGDYTIQPFAVEIGKKDEKVNYPKYYKVTVGPPIGESEHDEFGQFIISKENGKNKDIYGNSDILWSVHPTAQLWTIPDADISKKTLRIRLSGTQEVYRKGNTHFQTGLKRYHNYLDYWMALRVGVKRNYHDDWYCWSIEWETCEDAVTGQDDWAFGTFWARPKSNENDPATGNRIHYLSTGTISTSYPLMDRNSLWDGTWDPNTNQNEDCKDKSNKVARIRSYDTFWGGAYNVGMQYLHKLHDNPQHTKYTKDTHFPLITKQQLESVALAKSKLFKNIAINYSTSKDKCNDYKTIRPTISYELTDYLRENLVNTVVTSHALHPGGQTFHDPANATVDWKEAQYVKSINSFVYEFNISGVPDGAKINITEPVKFSFVRGSLASPVHYILIYGLSDGSGTRVFLKNESPTGITVSHYDIPGAIPDAKKLAMNFEYDITLPSNITVAPAEKVIDAPFAFPVPGASCPQITYKNVSGQDEYVLDASQHWVTDPNNPGRYAAFYADLKGNTLGTPGDCFFEYEYPLSKLGSSLKPGETKKLPDVIKYALPFGKVTDKYEITSIFPFVDADGTIDVNGVKLVITDNDEDVYITYPLPAPGSNQLTEWNTNSSNSDPHLLNSSQQVKGYLQLGADSEIFNPDGYDVVDGFPATKFVHTSNNISLPDAYARQAAGVLPPYRDLVSAELVENWKYMCWLDAQSNPAFHWGKGLETPVFENLTFRYINGKVIQKKDEYIKIKGVINENTGVFNVNVTGLPYPKRFYPVVFRADDTYTDVKVYYWQVGNPDVGWEIIPSPSINLSAPAANEPADKGRLLAYWDITNKAGSYYIRVTGQKGGDQFQRTDAIRIGTYVEPGIMTTVYSPLKKTELVFPAQSNYQGMVSVDPTHPNDLPKKVGTVPNGIIVDVNPSGLIFQSEGKPQLNFYITMDDLDKLKVTPSALGDIGVYYVNEETHKLEKASFSSAIYQVDDYGTRTELPNATSLTGNRVLRLWSDIEHTSAYGALSTFIYINPVVSPIASLNLSSVSGTGNMSLISSMEAYVSSESEFSTDKADKLPNSFAMDPVGNTWKVNNLPLKAGVNFIFVGFNGREPKNKIMVLADVESPELVSIDPDPVYTNLQKDVAEVNVELSEAGKVIMLIPRIFDDVIPAYYTNEKNVLFTIPLASDYRGEIPEGLYKGYVTYMDNAGNMANSSEEFGFIVDLTPPSVQIGNKNIQSSVTGYISDNFAVDKVEVYATVGGVSIQKTLEFNTGSNTTWSINLSNSELPEGVGEMTVLGYDKAGNINTQTVQITNNFSYPSSAFKLGVTSTDRFIPAGIKHGYKPWTEDAAGNGGSLSTGGIVYQSGISGQPDADGDMSWMVYNLKTEQERLGITGNPLRLTGNLGRLDGGGSIFIWIKTCKSSTEPSESDWINSNGNVESRIKIKNTYNTPIDLDIDNVHWIWVGLESASASTDDHGIFGGFSIHYGSDVIPSRSMRGLYAYYLFNEDEGTVVRDVSGTGIPLDIHISGSQVVRENSGVTFSESNHSSIIKNQSSADKLLKSSTETNELSIEIWLSPSDLDISSSQNIIGYVSISGDNRGNWALVQENDELLFKLRTSDYSWKTLETDCSLLSSVDEMYHVVLAYKPYDKITAQGGMKIFVNGQLIAKNNINGLLNSSGDNAWNNDYVVAVGNIPEALDRPWAGKISMTAIYNRCLNRKEITAQYLAGVPESSPFSSIELGVTTSSKVLPIDIVDGQIDWLEDKNAQGKKIMMQAKEYDRGVLGAPGASGEFAWMAYNLDSELEFFGITRTPISITGYTGYQDLTSPVSTFVKVSKTNFSPTDSDWENNTGTVSELFNSLEKQNIPLEIGVIDNKWVAIGTRASNPNASNQAVFAELKLNVGEQSALDERNEQTGLNYSYYEYEGSNLPDFSTLNPVKTGITPNFSITPRNREDYFAFLFEGKIEITTEGTYTFFLYSDDGSELYIDDKLIVSNGGRHSAHEKSGDVYLEKGFHKISVSYFERRGDEGLFVSYSGPGIVKTKIPDKILYKAWTQDDLDLWKNKEKIYLNTTSSGAEISNHVQNFPILVRLNSQNFDFEQANLNGEDIRFSNSAGSILSHQIERWNKSGEIAEIWVKVDKILAKNKNQYIVMYSGNQNAQNKSNGPSVFDVSNGYRGVYHLNEDGNTDEKGYKDATSNNAHGKGRAMTSSSDVEGIIGIAQDFEEQHDQRIELSHESNFDLDSEMAVSCWVKVESFNKGWQTIVSKGDNSWRISREKEKNTAAFGINGLSTGGLYGSININDGRWHHIFVSYNGSSKYLMIDGVVDVTESAQGSITKNDMPVWIGNNKDYPFRAWDGVIDELRISKSSRSTDWAKLCYANQKQSQSLLSFAAPSTGEQEDPQAPKNNVSDIFGFEAQTNWTINPGTIVLVTSPKTEGSFSYKIDGVGYQTLESVSMNTEDIVNETQTLSFDLYLGSNQPNQYWIGQVLLFVDCPSAIVNNMYIGELGLTNLNLGQFHTLSFALPSTIINLLKGSYSDFKFTIALNVNPSSGPYYFDNLRFEQ